MKRIFLGLALLCTLALSCREKPYENPVIANDCPDPSVLDNRSRDGYFYAYSTRSRIGDTLYEIPVWRSRDFVHWEIAGAAFTAETRPDWEPKGVLWAPDINYIDGKYVLYINL